MEELKLDNTSQFTEFIILGNNKYVKMDSLIDETFLNFEEVYVYELLNYEGIKKIFGYDDLKVKANPLNKQDIQSMLQIIEEDYDLNNNTSKTNVNKNENNKEVFIQRNPRPALNIVTEFADGGDLGQKIKKQKKVPFSESQILDYITQICLALQHIHKKKIIHRDLKSDNVFLMKSGIVKLGDFGIAKGLQSTWEKAKTFVGTPYYLSPEIIANEPYDSKSDIWALGVLLYELMTFKMPFNAMSFPLLRIKINSGKYKPPPSNYSSDIKNLLKKCLTLDPEKRPSIDEILKLPLIKNRINNYLKEIQYDQDLLITMEKKYKEERKNKKHKYKIVSAKNKSDIKDNNNSNDKNKQQINKEESIKINNINNDRNGERK